MKRTFVLIVTLLAFFVFGATFVRIFLFTPDSEVPAPGIAATAPASNVAESGQPARLLIPSLDIDADMQYVGITAAGNMGVPSNFSDVGWYKYGAVPGQLGSAVVGGHVDNAVGLPGVFKNLAKMKAGDIVYVETKDGSELRFVVTAVETYGYKDVPVEALFGRDDRPRLNLITCGGSWLRSERTYDERTVVYTVLAP